jgi:protein-arginine kinase activator protein McsA
VAFLTQFARSYDEVIREIYNPGREPDGMLRPAEARGEARPRRRKRRCEQCGRVYGSKEHHGKWFCSWACYLASPRPRTRREPVIPTVRQVHDEMVATLAAMGKTVRR